MVEDEKVEVLAKHVMAEAFRGMHDREGVPTYVHSINVSIMLGPQATSAERAIAYLHDVLEDTEWTVSMLKARGVPLKIIDSVVLLTRDNVHSYEEYIDNLLASGDSAAINVKIADLRTNITRRGTATKHFRRYWAALEKLLGVDWRYKG